MPRARGRHAERRLQGHQAPRRGHLRRRRRLPGGVTDGVVPRRGSPSAAWRRRRSGRRSVEAALRRPAVDAETIARGAGGARRGLRADHRLARLGRLPGDGGAQPAAAVLPGERRRAGAAGAEAGGLMEQKLDASRPRSAAACTPSGATISAHKHVTGLAEYTDDIAEPVGTLHAYLGLAERAHAEIVAMDLDAVRAAPGVVGVLTAADIPRQRREPGGQARRSRLRRGQGRVPRPADLRGGRRDARRARGGRRRSRGSSTATCRTSSTWRTAVAADYPLRHRALEARARRGRRRRWRRRRTGSRGGCGSAARTISISRATIAFAVPGEDDEVTVYSSTQHPSEVQHMVAHVLGVPSNAVTVIVRRMGGGFGGKETQPNLFAAWRRWRRRSGTGGEDPPRPRRRHGGDRQAARFPQRLRRRLRRRRAASWRSTAIFAARCGFSADLSGR